MTEKLKVCPFCEHDLPMCKTGNAEYEKYYVECPSCGARGYTADTKEGAIYTWERVAFRVNSKLKPCKRCGHQAREVITFLGVGVDCSVCGNATHLYSSFQEAICQWENGE